MRKEVVQLVLLARGTLSLLPSHRCSSELRRRNLSASLLPTVQLRAGAWRLSPLPSPAVPLRAGCTHCLWPTQLPPHPCSPVAQSVQRQMAWERQAWPSVKTAWYWAPPSGKRGEKHACRKSPWEYPEKGVPYASPTVSSSKVEIEGEKESCLPPYSP